MITSQLRAILGNYIFTLLGGLALAFFIVRYWPELIDVNPWWWFVLAVLFLAKPVLGLMSTNTKESPR